MLTADAREPVALGALEPGRVDGADAERGVGARVVRRVHLGGVDRREDGAEVLPSGGDRHAAVDQGTTADAAALVDDDPAHFLGVQNSGVAGDVLVEREAEEVAEGLFGLGPEPVGTGVRTGCVGEYLAVRSGGVPGHPHFDHVDVDTRPGESQRGHGAAVSRADDEGADVRAGVDRSGGGGGGRIGGGGVGRQRRGAQNRTGSSDKSASRDVPGTACTRGGTTHGTFLTFDGIETSSTAVGASSHYTRIGNSCAPNR